MGRFSPPLFLCCVAFALACKKSPPAATDAGIDGASEASAAPVEGDASFTSAAAALAPTNVEAVTTRALADAPRSGQTIDIAAGKHVSGSTPGDDGREPAVEPALVDVAMTAFSIDALPYPNDPSVPAKTGVTVDDARRLCSERGARLCTELEWERACKGPEGDAFASGKAWNAECEKEPARCASGFGARAMGTLSEWTGSRWVDAEGGETTPVVRGGAHRCASRAKGSSGIGFRCCRGNENAAKIGPIEFKAGFRKTGFDPDKLGKIFAQVPELARIGTDIRYFNEGDVKNMIARSGAAHEDVQFATAPVLWTPERGAEILVATGRGKSASFVVALWTLPGEKYRFGSSFVMLNDLTPVALAYNAKNRKELQWTSCWGCAGEQGSVSYRDDHRVVIVQH